MEPITINDVTSAEVLAALNEHTRAEREWQTMIESKIDNPARKWHIGKEIPFATIIVLVVQTVGVIWWAASTAAKVDFMKEANVAAQIVQTSIDRKQDEESLRSESRVIIQLDKLSLKIDRLIEAKGK